MVAGRERPLQTWKTFLRNHMEGIASIDLFVVPTIAFEQLFAFLVLGHRRRQLLWIAVTRNPTAEWLARQITEAFPWDSAPKYLVRDNDRGFGAAFKARVRAMGIRDRPTSFRSRWENGYVEGLIGSIRNECLDHLMVFNAEHLRRILAKYATYYNAASYCPSLYVIDTNRSDCLFRCPAGVARRLRTRSTRHFAASDCNVERMKSQGPSSRGCSASICRCSAAMRSVFGLTPSTAAARVKFIQPSASAVSGR